MYDYSLGDEDNYAADRAATETWLKIDPERSFTAWANWAFLGRVVRQFLDIGIGITTRG
jgi:hypothetical protein